MDPEFLRTLFRRSESETLDFKRDQYRFVGASDDDKAELLKDILAFANAWKESDAHIVVGAEEENGRAVRVVGAATDLKDSDVQQFIKSKTNRPVVFGVEVVTLDGMKMTVVTVSAAQDRPIYLRKSFGRLKANTVYVRRGSSTDEALPDEVAEMGASKVAAAAQLKRPRITLEFEHTKQIVHYRLDMRIPGRETEYADWLSVYARNEGASVANIVEVTVRVPNFLLPGHMPRELPDSIEDAELAALEFSNWLSDPVSHHMMQRKPAYRRQILPGKRLHLGDESTFPHEDILSFGSKLLWSVHCDDMPAVEGVTPYADIPFIDETKGEKR